MRSFMSMVGLPPDRVVPTSLRAIGAPRTCPSRHDSAAAPYAALVPDRFDLAELSDVPTALRPERIDEHRYVVANTGDAGQRDVVFGGQLLAQAIVATSLRHPGKDVRSIQAVFARPGRIDATTELVVDPMHDGRSFA